MVDTDSLVRLRGRAEKGGAAPLSSTSPASPSTSLTPSTQPLLWVPVLAPLPGVSTADSSQSVAGAGSPLFFFFFLYSKGGSLLKNKPTPTWGGGKSPCSFFFFKTKTKTKQRGREHGDKPDGGPWQWPQQELGPEAGEVGAGCWLGAEGGLVAAPPVGLCHVWESAW